jgi:AraC-like DNA-binding protein
MLFNRAKPAISGYFQCDLSTQRPGRDPERHAGLLYVTSGEGVWTVGPWKFPCRRGDMFALPLGIKASAELNPTRPLGYYYCYFEMEEGDAQPLRWPWNVGVPIPDGCPCASAAFKPELAAHFRSMQYELSQHTPLSMAAAKAQLLLLGVNFVRMLQKGSGEHSAVPVNGPAQLTSKIPENVARALDYVNERLQGDLSLADLASVARCSERRFVDLFRQALGISPMAYVRERRIREAQRLLTEGVAVKEIANRLNYADSHHFSRAFRQSTGISPTEYASGKAPLRHKPADEFARAEIKAS